MLPIHKSIDVTQQNVLLRFSALCVLLLMLLPGCQKISPSTSHSKPTIGYPANKNNSHQTQTQNELPSKNKQPFFTTPTDPSTNANKDEKEAALAKTRNQEALAKQQEQLRQQMLAEQKAKQSKVRVKNGADLPAFNKLMKTGVALFNKKLYANAKAQFLAAQRIAPQSPAVYTYLARIALEEKQATKAEILAKKGLLVSQSKKYDRQLWQIIYLSAKIRRKSPLMQKALQEIDNLK